MDGNLATADKMMPQNEKEANEPNYPKGTTKEQWDAYELELQNHVAWVDGRRDFLRCVLSTVENYSIDYARSYFNNLLNECLSMDAPNKPGYYRANND